MYNPELNDMMRTTQVSAQKQKSSLKKRVQMMDPDLEEEDDEEEDEHLKQKQPMSKRVVAPKKSLPKR